MKKNNSFVKGFNKYLILNFLMIVICIFSSLYIFYYNSNSSYNLMFLMPLFYGIAFCTVLCKATFRRFRSFYLIFTGLNFIRYVLAPIGTVFFGIYTGRSSLQPEKDSFTLAFIMILIEIVAVTILLSILNQKEKKTYINLKNKNEVKLPENNYIYILFILFTIGLIFVFPSSLNDFNFIMPNPNILHLDAELGLIEQIVSLCLSVSKQLVFLLFVTIFYKKYKKANSFRWILLTLVAIFFNIMIYSGLNRSDFIMMTIASTYLFYKLYPQYTKLVIISVLSTLVLILPAITAARQIESVAEGQGTAFNLVKMMQAYLGSPYNVAIAVEAAAMFPKDRHLLNLIYDFVRPTLGLNLLVKDLPLNYTNEFFNYRMYLDNRVFQILPMVGEGYFYFGLLFSSGLSLVFVKLGDLLTRIMENSKRIEIIYFLSITTTRLGFSLGQNASIQMNDLSFTLFVPLVIYWINNKVTLKKKL